MSTPITRNSFKQSICIVARVVPIEIEEQKAKMSENLLFN
jgi:hypothetical protein